ncbi:MULTISPECIES: pectinesterase family protein [unclassified Paenibacillus]|uniref:pectinesterase family protein n=1 Tax=unclassified Paenibacillus TaxID=185978 RepID=UPI001F2235F4|nr:pectinesterase family protein [Paenibacillus sp. JJ-223]CAH1196897.1 Pectinesterase A [Paenibacillus sp. JJ-223]
MATFQPMDGSGKTAYRCTVAMDGSGDYRTIQSALNAIPADVSGEAVISIRAGVYKEKLTIDREGVRLVGEGADNTVITYDDYALKRFPNGELYHTFHSYTVLIAADDFIAEGISFVNAAGPGKQVGQAIAAYVDGDRAAFRRCHFIGHQDTLFTGPLPEQPMDRSFFGGPRDGLERRKLRQYYEDCYIEGDVDFIFGSATALFQGCEIFSKNRFSGQEMPQGEVNGWITAASTPEGVRYGYVFSNCRLTGDAPPRSVYLGRPWRNDAKTCFLHCWMGPHLRREGWHNWNKSEAESTVLYAEYQSSGPGAAEAGERVPWAKVLSDEEAAEYADALVVAGEDHWRPFAR